MGVRARRANRAGLAALAVLALLPGCALHGLAFDNDHRVKFVSPRNRATVRLPVALRWDAAHLARTPGGGPFFAVFVDRAPIKPGQTLAAVGDENCKRTPGCPDLTYLQDQYVFVTRDTHLTLADVPKASGQRTGARDAHEATIVLVDARGGRIGENAYTVQFTIKGSH
jgi:hypothetical protein